MCGLKKQWGKCRGSGSQGESSKSISAADAYDAHKAKETNYSPSGVKLREP